MEDQHLANIITVVLTRAPQWIRHDLSVSDPTLRLRAEESLAAMIAAALRTKGVE
ncbi:DUF6771 family protein [Sphingobium sp. AN641]|uniref:DUF6771 family protein n=1 Tax=Sphingobium sp. AN641 TaxID=3133443 RepID=UPI0030C2BD53